ncbi:N-6 DNA methylase [Nostoc sp. NMS7]|uniref:N-6 DNA methylase n=1 Tax=Nostoc sp. NMS7 TaxID=2815391 RepID=UPI0025EED475|nr:N-6 DNA methylase [Nostoc sp. NMS7]
MVSKKNKINQPITTAQKLGSVVKSARDIMRTDKGLNGELDRLPQLTWIMFLKLLDDSEKLHEVEAELEGISYKPTIQPPYRWRDWAANENFTGDRLKSFINNDEAISPDGTKGAGLLAYLRNLKSKTGRDHADVIAKVFKDVTNRMISGTLLWDVLSKVNDIHFDKSEEVNLLSTLYESMLKEMRDAAGDSGEFYTPRPVVRFIVQVMEPKLGETIFDPACGTGGFLVEAYEYLKKNCSAQDWQILQKSIIGGEAKSLPLMLAHMSLLLHGFEYPDIDDGNSLRFTLSEMGEKDWVDVILTNPPFGGEEEDRIKINFPPDRQTKETAFLFLQLIMRRLRQRPKPGRAAVVFPNGVLFGDGICAKLRLVNDINVPFQLDRDAVRRGETHVHEALREALVNSLIHADHISTRPLVVTKFTNSFLFYNPGRLRISLEQLYDGGISDPRNPNLQKMFQMLGLGEKAGSGFGKILRAWKEQQWFYPLVSEELDLEMTSVALPMVSLIPENVEKELREIIGDNYCELTELDRIILVLAHQFGDICNSDIQCYRREHPRDIGDCLKRLVNNGWLERSGRGRGTYYALVIQQQSDLVALLPSSEHYEPSSEHYEPSSEHYGLSSEHYKRLKDIAVPVCEKSRVDQELVERVILELCSEHYLALRTLADLLNRKPDSIRNHYLSLMLDRGLIELRYPEQLNHPQQAYKTVSSPNRDLL